MTPQMGLKVMEIARKLVGCHYINGAYGATPGKQDGCPCRAGGIALIKSADRLNPLKVSAVDKNLAVFAAQMTVKQYCVCAGSWRSVPGGRWTDPEAMDLTTYLDDLRGKPVSQWAPYYQKFSPRRAFGPGQKGEVYWGESCEGIQHFDCIGFISFCIWKSSGKVMQHEISGWRATPNSEGGRVFTLLTSRPDALLDGDIIIKQDHHIGFVSKEGQIVEANATDKGVTSNGRFNLGVRGDWTHLVRLP